MRPDLATVENALSVDEIRRPLSAPTVGRRLWLCLYEAVPSTNQLLRELARAGAAEGTTVLAESQTAGRGRAGKAWFSPPGVNLYASVLCRPGITPAAAPVFSFVASLALADAIRELGLHPAIKWPNDVLVKHRKVAGTLTELSIAGDRLEHVILGVGVNVNVEREPLRAALGPAAQHAISLREALGRPVERNAFAGAFLTHLDEWLITYRDEGPERILQAWRDLDIVTGRRVEVRDDGAALEGRARGVAADGHLEIEDARGVVHRVLAGDVRLLE
jgi:BirA family biotin operon repressor/biotin-[acetyl-CoA-carboxylase] ligase